MADRAVGSEGRADRNTLYQETNCGRFQGDGLGGRWLDGVWAALKCIASKNTWFESSRAISLKRKNEMDIQIEVSRQTGRVQRLAFSRQSYSDEWILKALLDSITNPNEL